VPGPRRARALAARGPPGSRAAPVPSPHRAPSLPHRAQPPDLPRYTRGQLACEPHRDAAPFRQVPRLSATAAAHARELDIWLYFGRVGGRAG